MFTNSLTVVVLLWHYKQNGNHRPWTTLIHAFVSALIAGVMIVIILAIVKYKDTVSFNKNRKELGEKGVTEVINIY